MTTSTSSVPSTQVASEALAILLGTDGWSLASIGGGLTLAGPCDLTMTRSEILAVASLKNCGWRLDLDFHRKQTLTWDRRTDV